MRVLGERVLIEPKQIEKKTESGIILPEDKNAKVSTGVVVSVGTKVEEEGLEGKTVTFSSQFQEIEDKGITYYLMNIDNVLAVI